MACWKANRLGRCGTRLGLLALVLQLLAGAVPMPAAGAGPASAASFDVPAWVGASVCRAGDDEPAAADPVCPVCFVLCQAVGLPPPAVGGLALAGVATMIFPAGDRAALPAPARAFPARGPPVFG